MWYIFAHIPYTIFVTLRPGPDLSVFHTEKPAFECETLKRSHIGMQELHDFYSQNPRLLYNFTFPRCLSRWVGGTLHCLSWTHPRPLRGWGHVRSSEAGGRANACGCGYRWPGFLLAAGNSLCGHHSRMVVDHGSCSPPMEKQKQY